MITNRFSRGSSIRASFAALTVLIALRTDAAFITDLYNTGVNNAGNALPANAIDPHYLITVSPNGPSVARTVIDTQFPFPPWVPNNPLSRWIGPEATSLGPAGNYRYRTTFTVPANAILSTVNVSGLWGTDDASIAMRINGNLTPNVSAGFTSLVPFTINSGFVYGVNVLTFDLQNAGGPTGLRVDRAVGRFDVIPEPAGLGLACLSCVSLIALRRRNRRRRAAGFTSWYHPARRDLMIAQKPFALLVLAGFVGLVSGIVSPVDAHPLPGRDLLKFEQQPMIKTPVNNPNGTVGAYHGHDELSTAYGFPNAANVIPFYQGRYMADDFADNLTSPVVHVKWWGSYLDNNINTAMPVNKFLISFEKDVPAGPAPSFSYPGTPIVTQVVTRGPLAPGSGTFTETAIHPGGPPRNEVLYEYNAELNLGSEFKELKDTVYWLKIAALVDVPQGITFAPGQPPGFVTRWGWHNRDYTIQNTLASPNVSPGENLQGPLNGTPIWHFQDDAVTGILRFTPFDPNPLTNMQQPPSTMTPTFYLDGIDGPAGAIPGTAGIGAYSKDLAFALYTVVPEPATCLLLAVGLIAAGSSRRRVVSI